jgi:hypothetical protein
MSGISRITASLAGEQGYEKEEQLSESADESLL